MPAGEADPHGDYLATCPAEQRDRLIAIRAEIETRVPGTTRCMAYKMPALRKGRIIAYFAAFKHHIGLFPPVTSPPELIAELQPCRGPKGNLSFLHKEELPLDLIGRVGEALAAQYGSH